VVVLLALALAGMVTTPVAVPTVTVLPVATAASAHVPVAEPV
jgi:hypothetical protein